jgi:ATP-dependent Lon protease
LANVNELKKQGQMQLVSNQSAAAGNTAQGSSKDKNKKVVDESDVNLEEILNDISKFVFNIYKNHINPHADIHAARNPLDLLTEIESVMEHAMREISHIEDQDLDVVNKQEKERKGVYKKVQLQQKQIVEERENMAKNAELKARMDRVVEKVGKAMMPRSTKKKIKKEVVVVKIDEDRLDFMRYLGEDMAEMADEIKEKNGGVIGSTGQVSKNSSIIQP